jgi:protein phosphatase
MMDLFQRSDTREASVHENVDIECFGMTDIGQNRKVNQDHFVIGDLRKHMGTEYSSINFDAAQVFGEPMGKLLLVADGIGGAHAGEVASELAAKATVKFLLNSMHWLFHPTEPEVEKFIDDLKEAACFSHNAVCDDAKEQPERSGMGSTLTVAYIDWPMLYVLHVGDSRCYLLHQDKLGLLTKDQTFAQFLRDEGHLTDEEVERSPYQHVLMNAIGVDAQPKAAVYQQRLSYGDRIFLCSDGVNRHLSDKQIETHVRSSLNSKEICKRITDHANDLGGRDNITTVAARFLKPDQ